MHWSFIIAIVVILIVLTFLLVIFLPKPVYFYDPKQICPYLLTYDQYADKIQEEINTNAKSLYSDAITTMENSTENQINKITNNFIFVTPASEDMPYRDILPATCEFYQAISGLSLQILMQDVKTEKTFKGDDSYYCLIPLATDDKSYIAIDGEKKIIKENRIIVFKTKLDFTINNKDKYKSLKYLLIKLNIC